MSERWRSTLVASGGSAEAPGATVGAGAAGAAGPAALAAVVAVAAGAVVAVGAASGGLRGAGVASSSRKLRAHATCGV